MILDDFPPVASTLLNMLISLREESVCFKLLLRLIGKWTEHASEEFPKTVARINVAELQFQKKNLEEKNWERRG